MRKIILGIICALICIFVYSISYISAFTVEDLETVYSNNLVDAGTIIVDGVSYKKYIARGHMLGLVWRDWVRTTIGKSSNASAVLRGISWPGWYVCNSIYSRDRIILEDGSGQQLEM